MDFFWNDEQLSLKKEVIHFAETVLNDLLSSTLR